MMRASDARRGRPDAAAFPDDALGEPLDGWDGARGCDGVDPDNVDGYANPNGVGLNATEQLDHLKQAADLVAWFDGALNQECAAYDECSVLSTFTGAGKAAFHVAYVDDFADAPALADAACGVGPDLDTLIKEWAPTTPLPVTRLAAEGPAR